MKTTERIAQLRQEIEDNFGKRGNAERREQLAALVERQRVLDNYRWVLKQRLHSADHKAARPTYHAEETRKAIAWAAKGEYARGEYGQLTIENRAPLVGWLPTLSVLRTYPTHPALAHLKPYLTADETLKRAFNAGLLPEPWADFDRKGRGKAVNYDLYGFAQDGALILVQQRIFERRKYTNVTLRYYVTDGEAIVEIQNGAKSLIKRAAATSTAPDITLRAVYGKLPADWQAHIDPTPVSYAATPATGYKLVEFDADQLLSLYDASPWSIGQERKEQLGKDHAGGLYYYASPDKARALAKASWGRLIQRFALLEVRATGAHRRYGDKLACSSMTPVRVVEYI